MNEFYARLKNLRKKLIQEKKANSMMTRRSEVFSSFNDYTCNALALAINTFNEPKKSFKWFLFILISMLLVAVCSYCFRLYQTTIYNISHQPDHRFCFEIRSSEGVIHKGKSFLQIVFSAHATADEPIRNQ